MRAQRRNRLAQRRAPPLLRRDERNTRSNATAAATDASSVGRDVCSARATAPSCRRRFRARSAAAAAAAAAAARSDDDASRASVAARPPATRSTNPDRGSPVVAHPRQHAREARV